ncbi:MAG: hypothetical protein A3F82_05185 [Deltaproteobacteria bacterium RIFCSPLOWO2_12_FULL_44_12]|nr:MAG: hypothetical protein A2712_02125 [Deltaproteobacteria bacterium RIFCSPHIGHO2_01_FULL_43_49]OGQ15078.1 MAG: hypothetical protein A3D22_03355 [Deltaproteobacteria bacterium RIFCSPHIGHO2_02_FULL_44_53]OGQ27302.1 MAG: hypothetical protein A3D98_02720 [Deltaproteobacteria bacterium RIFCSPHIGHO2_12_FULL_44_21]OGQ31595.1 MAG: hypothetical protein A2979_04515 [Deltaproteobacteria bacterium RIFCSPLOWO2_01_FULL_45_74]OGQ42796.1 MAG: hypothetical protein A3I70_06820 [Deltaproteobacteria bacterium 
MIYRLEDIVYVQVEVTSKCNSACPQCPRNVFGGRDLPTLPLVDLTLEDCQKIFPEDFVRSIKTLYMCGTYGDPIVSRYTLDTVRWLRSVNPSLEIGLNTNGSAGNASWWSALALLLGHHGYVTFSIDGLEDTNAIYRRNTSFKKIIENAKIFIGEGGRANWDFIVFKHNEHQVESARQFSKEMGFSNFTAKRTGRFFDKNHKMLDKQPVLNKNGEIEYFLEKPEQPQYQNQSLSLYENVVKKYGSFSKYLDQTHITCNAKRKSELYVSAEGLVFPCGWLHDRLYGIQVEDTPSSKQLLAMIDKNGGMDSINAKKRPLKTIVEETFFNLIEQSWRLKTVAHGKLERCAVMCGERFNTVGHQYDEKGHIHERPMTLQTHSKA